MEQDNRKQKTVFSHGSIKGKFIFLLPKAKHVQNGSHFAPLQSDNILEAKPAHPVVTSFRCVFHNKYTIKLINFKCITIELSVEKWQMFLI